MAHVFISYSSKHRALTEEIAACLENHGLEVWWDRQIVARGPFDSQIQEQLRLAGCILVLWTEGAVVSEWVAIEAQYGLDADKIVCARDDALPAAKIPEAFAKIDAHKLHGERDRIIVDVLAVREGRLLLEDRRQRLPPPDVRPLTSLLLAKYGVVPFTGSAMRQSLVDWALSSGGHKSPPRRAAGRLVHGPGGLGKTRLLIEAADTLRATGWSAGFVQRPSASDEPFDTPETRSARRQRQAMALGYLIRGATDKGLLLVMDYAENRGAEIRNLARLIAARPDSDMRPIRLVLLARSDGDWWNALLDENEEVRALFGREGAETQLLEGITTVRERQDMFEGAVHALAPRLREMGYPTPGVETARAAAERVAADDGRQGGSGYDRPLAIAMEALLHVMQPSAVADKSGVHVLLGNILGLERAHWPKLVGRLEANATRDLSRAVAQVTALQGVESRGTAEDVLMADTFYRGLRLSRASVSEPADNLSRIYGQGEAILQLEPDLLGEHHVATVADLELVEGCVAWTAALAEPDRTGKRVELVTVLQRATRSEHGEKAAANAARMLEHLVQTRMGDLSVAFTAVSVATPGRLIDILEAAVPTLRPDAVEQLLDAISIYSVRLAPLALLASRRSLTHLEAHGQGDRRQLSVAFHDHSNRARNMGAYGEAAAAAKRSVELMREVFNGTSPDAIVLAARLATLANAYTALGQRDRALGASEDAFETIKDAFGGVIVVETQIDVLYNRAQTTSDAGQDELALERSTHLIEVFRSIGLETSRPRKYGAALLLHSHCLFRTSDYENAKKVAATAIAHWRGQTAVDPDSNRVDLTRALVNHGIACYRLGEFEAARASTVEAIEIRRQLAADQPDAYTEWLGQSLINLTDIEGRLGATEAALAAAAEARVLFEKVTDKRPDVGVPNIARSFGAAALVLAGADRHEEAIEAFEAGLRTLEPWVVKYPAAFEPIWAQLWTDYLASCEHLGVVPDATLVGQQPFQLLPLDDASELGETPVGRSTGLVAWVTSCFGLFRGRR